MSEFEKPLLEKIKGSATIPLNVDLLERDISRFIHFGRGLHHKTQKAAGGNPALSGAREELKTLLQQSEDLFLIALQADKSASIKPMRRTIKDTLKELDQQKRPYKDAVRHARDAEYPTEYIDNLEDARWAIIEDRIAEQAKLDGTKSREALLVEIFVGPIKKIQKLALKEFKNYENGASEKNGTPQQSKRKKQYEDLVEGLSEQGIEVSKVEGMERDRRQTNGQNGHKKAKNRDTAYDALLSIYDDIIKVLQRKVDSPSR